MNKILIVEDDPGYAKAYEGLAVSLGMGFDSVPDGDDAIALFCENSYYCAILDIYLYGASGLEVLAEIRRSSQIPAIVVSSSFNPKERQEAEQLGISGYVTKRGKISSIVAKIRENILCCYAKKKPSEKPY